MGADSGHHHCTCTGQGGGGGPDDHASKISRTSPDWASEGVVAFTVGHRFSAFSGHSRPTHTSVPPFLDPLNSFQLSLFADSSPLERYDKNKVGRLLDRVFGNHSNLWTKVRVLMCSLSLGISVDIWFVNFGHRLVSFPFLGHLG